MYAAMQTVYLDMSNLDIPEHAIDAYYDLLDIVYQKVSDAFAGTNVEVVLAPPESGEYSTMTLDNSLIDGSGITGLATLDTSFIPYDNGVVLIGNIFDIGAQLNISPEQLANWTANTVAHEIGHLSGLDHVYDPDNIMNAEASERFLHSPPIFSPDQVHAINTNAVVANFDDSSFPHEDQIGFDDIALNTQYDDVINTRFDDIDADDSSGTDFGF